MRSDSAVTRASMHPVDPDLDPFQRAVCWGLG